MKIRVLFSLFLLIGFFMNAQHSEYKLVAHYPFNGTANDESGNANHGENISCKSTEDRFGNPNSAFFFDGRYSYIKVPHSSSIDLTKDFTISIWFKAFNLTKDPGGHHIAFYRKGMVAKETSYALMFDVKDNIPKGLATKLRENTWYNIISIRKPSENYSATYVNGVLVQSGGAGELKANTLPLCIGASLYRGGASDKFKGIIDDIKIYSGKLNECELALLLGESQDSTSPKERIANYTMDKVNLWKQKDEYETTKEHEKRINSQSEVQRATFEKEIIDEVAEGILWQCGTKQYDADKEAFTLTFNNVEPFQLEVPRSEARQFGDNFDQLEYLNPSFSIGDTPNLIVDCMEIKNPTNGKIYKYGCEPAMVEIPKDAIKVKSKTVTIKMWDDQKEDGDIVSVFLNDARIKKEIAVKKNEHIFTIELKEGVNIFKLLAHNEGDNPPNTAAILIDDGTDEYQRVLSSKKGEFAELKIVLE